MKKSYDLYQVDSFTTEKFRGNPAGVVPNADGLSDVDMLNIAREMNCSETAFLFRPTASDHDVWIRFFTPTTEVPICGHATIAAHYVRAFLAKKENERIRQKTGAGLQEIRIDSKSDGIWVTMSQPRPQLGPILKEPVKSAVLSAMGIQMEDLLDKAPVQVVSNGMRKVMVPLRKRATLSSLQPDILGLRRISSEIGCNGYFPFTLDTPSPTILTSARMFAPAIGINEDPVTGMAHGPLAAYLLHHRLANSNGPIFSFQGLQGEAMGRPGICHVTVYLEGGELSLVEVAGTAIIAYRTEIEL